MSYAPLDIRSHPLDIRSHRSDWAWENFKQVIVDTISERKLERVAEIGGGRSPLLSQADVRALDIESTVIDISAEELTRAPNWVRKITYDISSAPAITQRYDFMFSKLVFEHIKDVRSAYKNIYDILDDGGICINFHPTLYALPFLINFVLPTRIAFFILRVFYTSKNSEGRKFPAYYSLCRTNRSVERTLASIGFRDVRLYPFYGHGYYKRLPFLHRVQQRAARFAERHGLTFWSAFCYTVVQK